MRGATNTRSLSTRPPSRNAAASVGPPSRRTDWTPSEASCSSSSRSGPDRSSSSRVVGKRPLPERDPARLPDDGHVARVEARIVPAHRAHPDRDGVGLRAEEVDEPARVLAGDPARSRHADAAVERDRHLVRDERSPGRDPRPPLLDLLTTSEAELSVGELDVDAVLPKPVEAATVIRMWIELSGDDTRHPGRQERIDARRRRPVMRAGLERDVDRRAACVRSRRLQCDDLGVRAAPALVPAFADDLAAGDDHRADDGVRVGRPPAVLGELERAFEEPGVHGADPTGPPYAAPVRLPPALVRHVEPRACMARRVAAARLRVRGAVVARARGADRHAPLARRSGGRARAQAERAVPHRSRHRGRRPRALGRTGSCAAARPRSCARRPPRRALRSGHGAVALPTVDESAVVAELLPRLQLAIGETHPFTLLATEADRWAEDGPAAVRRSRRAVRAARCSTRRSTSTARSTGRRPTS